MFDIFLGKNSKKNIFELPDKSYNVDFKNINKYGLKELINITTEQDKYIKQIVKKFNDVCAEHHKSTQKIDELTQKNEVINAQIKRMVNEHEELSVKFGNLQIALEVTLNDNQKNTKQKSKASETNKIQLLIEEQVSMIKQKQQFESTADLEKQLRNVFAYLRNRASLAEKIEVQNRKLKQRLEKVEQQNQQLEGQLKAREEGVKGDTYKLKYEEVEEECGLLEQQLQKSKHQLQMLKNNFQAKQKQFQLEYQDLQNDYQLIAKENADHKQEIMQLKNFIVQKEGEVTIAKNVIIEKQRILLEMRSNGQSNEKDFEVAWRLQETISELNKKLAWREKAMENNETEFQGKLKEQGEKLRQLEFGFSFKEEEMKMLKIEISNKDSTLSERQKKIVQLNKYIKEATIPKATAQQWKSEIDTLRKTIKQITAQKQQLNNKTKQTTAQKQQLNNKIKEITTQKQQFNNKIKQITSQKQQLNNKIKNVEKDNESLNAELKTLNAEIKQLRNKQQNFEKQQHESKIIIQSLRGEVINKDELYNKCKATAANDIQQLEKQIISNQELMKKYCDEVEEKNIQIKQLISAKTDVETALANLKEKAKRQIEQLQKNLADKAKELEETNLKLRRQDNEMNQDKIKIEGLKKTIAKNEQKLNQNKKSMEKIYEDVINRTQRNTQLEDKLKEYKKQIHKQKAEKQELQDSYERRIKQLIDIKDTAQKLKQTIQNQSINHIEQKQQEYKIRIQNMEETVNGVNTQNQKLVQEIETLKETSRANQVLVKTLSDKREQAIREIERLQKLLQQKPDKKLSGFTSPKDIALPQNNDKVKKIADKAFRGFGVLLKNHLQPMYKQFVNEIMADIKQEKASKFQKSINDSIIKSADMRDVFSDYL